MLLVLKSCRALLKTAGKIAMHGMAHEARIIDSLESCVFDLFFFFANCLIQIFFYSSEISQIF